MFPLISAAAAITTVVSHPRYRPFREWCSADSKSATNTDKPSAGPRLLYCCTDRTSVLFPRNSFTNPETAARAVLGGLHTREATKYERHP